MHNNGQMNQRLRGITLYWAGLLAATAAVAMPVTQPLNQLADEQRGAEFVQLNALSSLALKPETGIKAIAGLASNSPLLMDLAAKHPGAEFEAVLVKSEALPGAGPRPNIRAEQELFSGVAKDALISAELKNILKDLRGELHQLTGEHFRDAQAAGAAEQARLAQRLDEVKSAGAQSAHAAGRSVSEEERRLGAWQVVLKTEQLIEEIKPWAITALVLYGLFHAAQALMRKQAAVKLVRGKPGRQVGNKVAEPAAAALQERVLQPAKGQRVRVRQRIRLGSSSSKSRQRRLF
ncbi:MAG: hypothetical protein IV107_15060 [Paucibacter sp.]|nr:hypothetical protein [Roseateles sp.]